MQESVNKETKDLLTNHSVAEQACFFYLSFSGNPVCNKLCAGHKKYKDKINSPCPQRTQTSTDSFIFSMCIEVENISYTFLCVSCN